MGYSFVEYASHRYQNRAFELLDIMRKLQYDTVDMPMSEIEKNSTPYNTAKFINEMNLLHYRAAYNAIIKNVLQPKHINQFDELTLKIQRCVVSQIASYRNPHLKSTDVLIELLVAGMSDTYIAFAEVSEMERIAYASNFLKGLLQFKIIPNKNWVDYWMDSIYDPNFEVQNTPPICQSKISMVKDLLNIMHAERRMNRYNY